MLLVNEASHSILVRGGLHLEEMGAVRAVALDKTGTLTNGKYGVQEVVHQIRIPPPPRQSLPDRVSVYHSTENHYITSRYFPELILRCCFLHLPVVNKFLRFSPSQTESD